MTREPEISISDYPNVKERINLLGLQMPSSIALLPRNFDTADSKDDLLHEGEAPTVRVLFRKAQIVETPIELPGEVIPKIAEHDFHDWIAPILLYSYSALTQNSALLNISLGVISNYLTDLFKGLSSNRGVRLDIVVEKKNGSYKKVHYEGPLEGLATVEDVVYRVIQDE